jgi:hypothetical protein
VLISDRTLRDCRSWILTDRGLQYESRKC